MGKSAAKSKAKAKPKDAVPKKPRRVSANKLAAKAKEKTSKRKSKTSKPKNDNVADENAPPVAQNQNEVDVVPNAAASSSSTAAPNPFYQQEITSPMRARLPPEENPPPLTTPRAPLARAKLQLQAVSRPRSVSIGGRPSGFSLSGGVVPIANGPGSNIGQAPVTFGVSSGKTNFGPVGPSVRGRPSPTPASNHKTPMIRPPLQRCAFLFC